MKSNKLNEWVDINSSWIDKLLLANGFDIAISNTDKKGYILIVYPSKDFKNLHDYEAKIFSASTTNEEFTIEFINSFIALMKSKKGKETKVSTNQYIVNQLQKIIEQGNSSISEKINALRILKEIDDVNTSRLKESSKTPYNNTNVLYHGDTVPSIGTRVTSMIMEDLNPGLRNVLKDITVNHPTVDYTNWGRLLGQTFNK